MFMSILIMTNASIIAMLLENFMISLKRLAVR